MAEHTTTSEIAGMMAPTLTKPQYLDLICTMAMQVTKSLEKLHSLGFVHGDVKPANILFLSEDRFDKFVLIDFGISRRYLDEYDMHIYQERVRNFSGNLEFGAIE